MSTNPLSAWLANQLPLARRAVSGLDAVLRPQREARPPVARRRRRPARLAVIFCSLFFVASIASATRPQTDTTGWFPLTLPWDTAAFSYTDASDLLLDAPGQDPAAVIGNRGFVVADANGHFIFSNTGQRARFWGTNLTFSAAFPPSPDFPPDAAEFPDIHAAEKLAARLARLGFDAVRLHHLDNRNRPGGLWLDSQANTQDIDPVQLGRLDYLIYCLKQRGIYVDLNLHVSREFVLGDGVTDADAEGFIYTNVAYNRGATLFDPIMIGLQQQYAAQLLRHINPYTGLRYADDPVILFVETINEDSMTLSWALGLLNYDPDNPRSLPAFYDQELDGWSELAADGSTLNRLRNPGFEDGLTDWWRFTTGAAQAVFSADANAYAGSRALKVQITQPDNQAWHVQFGQDNLALQEGVHYRLRFALRANQPTTIYGRIRRNGEPWDSLGWEQAIAVGTGWSVVTAEFVANETIYGGAQLSFDVGQAVRTLWFDAFELCEATPLRGWHGWLKDRYGSTAAIRAAWAPPNPLPEPELLANGSFESGLPPWFTWVTAPAQATLTLDSTTATAGTRSLRTTISQVGSLAWHVLVAQGDLALQAGQTYRLTFDAKTNVPGAIGVNVMQNHDPWNGLGLWGTAEPGATWQSFTFVFKAEADEADARVAFDLGQSVRTIWIDNVSLKPHNPWGLQANESLESNNIARIRLSEILVYSDQRLRDTLRFYDETQARYFTTMGAYIRQTLGVHALNPGTAITNDNLADLRTAATLDFVDNHFYSDQPMWGNNPAWSATEWYIANTPWVNDPFQGLFDKATTAVQGKPFTLTEFNQVFPNRYAVEGPFILATAANLQDWDAVFQFDYASEQNKYNTEAVNDYFDLAGNPLATALMPIASRLFLGGQTAPALTTSALNFTIDESYDSARYGWSGEVGAYLRQAKGVDDAAVFGSRLRINRFDAPAITIPNLPTPVGPTYVSAGGQLVWDVSDPQRGVYRFDAPQIQGAAGFLAGRTVTLSRLTITAPANTASFAAVALQSWDGAPLDQANHMILSLFSRVENTGMIWNEDDNSIGDDWGGPPTLVEPLRVNLTLTLPNAAQVQVWALDPAGALHHRLAPQLLAVNRLRLDLDTGADHTVWYALLRPPAAPHQSFLPALE